MFHKCILSNRDKYRGQFIGSKLFNVVGMHASHAEPKGVVRQSFINKDAGQRLKRISLALLTWDHGKENSYRTDPNKQI